MMPSIAQIKFKVKQALVDLFHCLQGKEHEAIDYVLQILKENARKTLKDFHEPTFYESNLLPSINLPNENENRQSFMLYNIDQSDLSYENSCNNYNNTPMNNSLLNNTFSIYNAQHPNAGTKEQVDNTTFCDTSLDLNEDSTTRLCIDIDAEMNSSSLDYVSQIDKFIPLGKSNELHNKDNSSFDSHLHESSNMPYDSSKTLFENETGSTFKDNLVTLLSDDNDFPQVVCNQTSSSRYTLLESKAPTNDVIQPVAVYENLSLQIKNELQCVNDKKEAETKLLNKNQDINSSQYESKKSSKDAISLPSPSHIHSNNQTNPPIQNFTASLNNSDINSVINKLLTSDAVSEVDKNPITIGKVSDIPKDEQVSDIINNINHPSATMHDNKINVALESTDTIVKHKDQKGYNTRFNKHKEENLPKSVNHSEKNSKSKSSIIEHSNQDIDLDVDTEKKLKISRICCFLCGQKIKNKINLVKHMCEHEGSPLSCRKCCYVYENRSHFNAHLAFCSALKVNGTKGLKHEFNLSDIISLDPTKFAVCSYCGQRFGSNSYLRYHIKHLTCLRTADPTKCKICRSCFKTDSELQDHISKLHNHTCPVCKKVFPSVSLLAAHRKKHVRVHQCASCVASFRSRALLRQHSKVHQVPAPNAKPKMFECSSCEFKSPKEFNYKRHVRQMHGQPGPHACSKCPAILRTPHSLREHERAHGARQFECGRCGVAFAYRASLVRHLAAHRRERAPRPPAAGAAAAGAASAADAAAAAAAAAALVEKEGNGEQKEPDKKCGKVRLSIAVGQSPAEQQFLSLVDVRSGEMLTLPACYAHLLLPPQGAQYNPGGDDIVVITNVPSLECEPPLVMYQESGQGV